MKNRKAAVDLKAGERLVYAGRTWTVAAVLRKHWAFTSVLTTTGAELLFVRADQVILL